MTVSHTPEVTDSSAGLPLGELIRPLPLLAVALLAVNDHLLKGAGVLPGWLTGKLSDVAGLLFFPLLLTALWNTSIWVIRYVRSLSGGPPLLPGQIPLRQWQIWLALSITAIGFGSLQLFPPAAEGYLWSLEHLGFPSAVTPDPTDLWALLVLPVTYRIAIREQRRRMACLVREQLQMACIMKPRLHRANELTFKG